MTEYAMRLHEMMSHTEKNHDAAAAACHMILEVPEAEQTELFYRFLLEFKYGDSDESQPAKPYFSEADTSLYYPVCQGLLQDWFKELQADARDEDAFHAALWQKIRELTNKPLQAMMAAVCAESLDLPYLSPSRLRLGAELTPEAFKAAVHALEPKVTQMIQHILNQESPHVAQDVAAFLPLLEACADRQEVVVLLSAIVLGLYEKIQLAEVKKMLRTAADRALDKMIRETMEEYDG